MNTELTEELTKLGIPFKQVRNNPYELEMRCFSGLHEDNNPSLHYNVVKEVFNCFSCGYRGNKKNLYTALGISLQENLLTKQGFKIEKLKNKLNSITMDTDIELPVIRFPLPTPFKGISIETLQEFEAFTTETANMEDYVWIPIYQNEKLVSVNGRYKMANAEGVPKYINLPRNLDMSEILFPMDKIKDPTSIILVEGMYDMLRLWDLNVKNAICLMGVTSFTYKKAKMLANYGCQHVTILLDGDDAGRKAGPIIKDLLARNFIDSEIVSLEDGLDPGAFTKEHLSTYLSKFVLDN